jgi:hypothetical protein
VVATAAAQCPEQVRFALSVDAHIDSGVSKFNFADRPTKLGKLYDADTLARLREVKDRYVI